MSDPTAQGGQPRRGIFFIVLWGVLLASLLLNAFLIGGIIGHRARAPGGAAMPPVGTTSAGDLIYSPRAIWPDLSPERRRTTVKELVRMRGVVRAQFEEVRQSRLAVLAALEAEPFDLGAYAAALERSRAADLKLREISSGVMVSLIGSLSDEERRAVVEGIEQRRAERSLRAPGERPRRALDRLVNPSDEAEPPADPDADAP